MTPAQAAARWQRRQARILRAAYQSAWQAGAANYRSQHATPPVGPAATTAPPAAPAPAAMARALGPALLSLARMGAVLATIVPTAAQIAAAPTLAAAYALAARALLGANLWRLAGAMSVVWAAEQAGYSQAAAADGLLIQWQLDPNPRVHHCEDCPALAALPPMPYDQWPTLPGEGQTACDVGCRCSLRAVRRRVAPLTADQTALIARIAARQPVLVAA